MSLVHKKSDDLARHYCEGKDKYRKEAEGWECYPEDKFQCFGLMGLPVIPVFGLGPTSF